MLLESTNSTPIEPMPFRVPFLLVRTANYSTTYLQGKSNLRWAMAARSKSKLEVLRSDLAKINPAMKVSVKTDPMRQTRALMSSEEP